MVNSLPEELLEQANLLLTFPPNQANLRRAVSTAYYGLFHLLIRSAVMKWSDPLHQARIARMFEHERMKKICGGTIKSIRAEIDFDDSNSTEARCWTELTKVAQAFIILQQARHNADYNLESPLDPADAMAQVKEANAAFVDWELPAAPKQPENSCFHCCSKRRNGRRIF